jgi:hypothetical protein
VLRQTAAVLVALAARLAANFYAAALLAILGQRLSVAGSSYPALVLVGRRLVGRELVGVVVDGAAVRHLPLGLEQRLVVG